MIARTHAWLCAALLLASCGSPIVGAECRAGWLDCDGVCVEVQNDPNNCGVCGKSCGGFECIGGMCSRHLRADAGMDGGLEAIDGGLDASLSDGGADASTHTPPGKGKGGVGSAPFGPDGGLMLPDDAAAHGCAIGLTECGGVCADSQHDPKHCGDCNTQCPGGQYCVDGMCKDVCTLPLHLCNGACVDYDSDENNCGSCGHVCTSGICTSGVCADTFPGSLVVIGHDYSASASMLPPVIKRIAGNSALLPASATPRVLIYRGKTSSASYSGVRSAIDLVANDRHITWDAIEVGADAVTQGLRDVDSFVVMPQQGASDAQLQALGEQWGLAMSQFLLRGGVIVLFDTPSTKNAGTYQVLQPAGLFTASAREQIPNKQVLSVADPTGAVVLHLPSSPYPSKPNTVRFLDVSSDGSTVIADPSGKPVVVLRVVVP
jgi:hypothetical protein